MSPYNIEHVLAQITYHSTHPALTTIIRNAANAQIHSILSFDRWVGISIGDYYRILPALRLASQILMSPRSLHFFYARLSGPTELVYDDQGIGLVRFSRDNVHSNAPLCSEKSSLVAHYLNDLAPVVTLDFKDQGDDGSSGHCESRPHERINAHAPGIRSNIAVNLHYIHRLDLASPTSGPTVLKTWVNMAVTLCHEICHALNYACEGYEEYEQFFEDDSFAELGHAFEQFVFGGQLTTMQEHSESELLLTLYVWPPEILVKRNGRYLPTISRAAKSGMDIGSIVSDGWTEQLFDERFWLETVAGDGGQSLKVPDEFKTHCPHLSQRR